MALNEGDYKKVYNVAECAGVVDANMSTVDGAYEVYSKIADWVNNEPELNSLFTADIRTVVEDSRYSLRLLTENGVGFGYGYIGSSNSSGGNSTYTHILQKSNGGILTESIGLNYLRLMVIKSRHGFIAGFYNTNNSKKYRLLTMFTECRDSDGQLRPVTFLLSSSDLYISLSYGSSIYAETYFANNSYSDKTGLFTFMPPYIEPICENVRLCRGAVPKDHVFFEAGDKTWCCITNGDNYAGLALCIE